MITDHQNFFLLHALMNYSQKDMEHNEVNDIKMDFRLKTEAKVRANILSSINPDDSVCWQTEVNRHLWPFSQNHEVLHNKHLHFTA